MSPSKRSWGGQGLVLATLVCAIAIPLLAQPAGSTTAKDPAAKDKVALIRDGQATLAEATKIAEQHAKGVALAASSRLEPWAERMKLDPEQPVKQDTRARLMYDLQVFVNDQVQKVTVDGLERKVTTEQGAKD